MINNVSSPKEAHSYLDYDVFVSKKSTFLFFFSFNFFFVDTYQKDEIKQTLVKVNVQVHADRRHLFV